MIISITEHQRIWIKGHRCEEPPAITPGDAERLEKLFIDDVPVFVRMGNYVMSRQWIGVVDLPGLSIEILPKISGNYDRETLRKISVRMLCVANDIPTSNLVSGSVSWSKCGIKELLILNFIERLKRYVEYGLLFDYSKATKELPVVKGRIDFQSQIARGEQFPTRFTCTYSPYRADNKINRVLLCAIEQMLKDTNSSRSTRELMALRSAFEGVSLLPLEMARTYSVTFNSVNARANDVYTLAKMYLDNIVFHYDAGQNRMQLMLFDMNALFERFIYRSYHAALGNNVKYQYNSRHMLKGKNGHGYIRLRPDIMVKMGDETQILDTKWKITSGVPKESDTYQMNAYASAFDNVHIIRLLYPLTQEMPEGKYEYEFNVNINPKPKLIINAVNLGLCLDRNAFKQHLLELIQD